MALHGVTTSGGGGGGESTELTTTQIAALSTTQANALSATQAAGLSVAAVKGMTTDQIAGLTTTAINTLADARINAMTVLPSAAVSALTTTQIAGLNATNILAITSTQHNALNSTQFALLTATEISATPTAALAGLTTTQVNAMGAITLSSTQTISGEKDFTGQVYVEEIIEKFSTFAVGLTGTLNYNILTDGQCLEYTTNAAANWIVNIRGDASNTLNSMLGIGEMITIGLDVNQGSTAYYMTAAKIDGNATGENGYTITISWQGGSAPTSGNASSIDRYCFNVRKIADKSFKIVASVTKYGA